MKKLTAGLLANESPSSAKEPPVTGEVLHLPRTSANLHIFRI